MYAFSPSLMCMDLLALKAQVEFLNGVADFYHVDIMDGHFVPNITLSPFFMSCLKDIVKKPMDAHLMVTDPSAYVGPCVDAGAGYFSFHAETVNGKAFRLIDDIRARGAKVGLVLNPETSIDEVRYYLPEVDKVTVMSVDPGFAGQRFIRPMLGKIEAFRDLREKEGYSYIMETDGSCNMKTFRDLAAAGTEVFIVGSSGLFGLDPDLKTAWRKMKDGFDSAVAGI